MWRVRGKVWWAKRRRKIVRRDNGKVVEFEEVKYGRFSLKGISHSAYKYFSVDYEIIWDIINNELPVLKRKLKLVISSLG